MIKAIVEAVDSIEDCSVNWKSITEILSFRLCLDEMNLAPVEQYFADYLSILEIKKWAGNNYTSDIKGST